MLARVVLLVFAIGCGGTYGGKPTRKTTPAATQLPAGGIAASALPYSVVDARTGRAVDTPELWVRLDKARVVCVGEDHQNPHHHWFQLEVVTQLTARNPGKQFALGMEMFQRPFQGVLDDFAAKRIDQAAMLSRTGFEDRWGFDYGFYGPTIDKTIAAGGALLALNTPREVTKKVARKGLESLTPEERAALPQLVLDDKAHRAWFDSTMEAMGGAEGHSSEDPHEDKPPEGMPSGDRIYAAQVLWDETMAEVAAKWLTANPSAYMVVLAGNGHCHDSAIINRLKRRGIHDVLSLHPVLDVEGRVAEALAKPINDFVIVLTPPKS